MSDVNDKIKMVLELLSYLYLVEKRSDAQAFFCWNRVVLEISAIFGPQCIDFSLESDFLAFSNNLFSSAKIRISIMGIS